MNPNLKKLTSICQKQERLILGLMSGTSLDGLDLALCRVCGSGRKTAIELLHFHSESYTPEQKYRLRSVTSQTHADLINVTLLNAWLADVFAQIILKTLDNWYLAPDEIDCIASHGHTIYHAPRRLHQQSEFPNATLQIADGDHIAQKTGIITIHDFRQKHLAVGGEGAPLALYGDYLLFASEKQDLFLLNIGGIANISYLPIKNTESESFASDLGAGNCLMDWTMRQYFNQNYDAEGKIATRGYVQESLLRSLQSHPFFLQDFPKTTGLELFDANLLAKAQLESQTQHITPEDLLATLNYFTAWGIAKGILKLGKKTAKIVVSGGGAYNAHLLNNIRQQLPSTYEIQTSMTYQIPPDAKEAMFFALLANQTIMGEGLALGDLPSVSLGKISLPN